MKKLSKIAALALASSMALGVSAPAQAGLDPFVGEVTTVGFNFCPRGWAEANGALLPINQNTALFSLLGTTYGGDGRTTFGLPDLRGRSIVGRGSGAGLTDVRWGERGGRENITLTSANLPAHSHAAQMNVVVAAGTKRLPGGSLLAASPDRIYEQDTAPDGTLKSNAITVGNTGANQSFNNRSPYLGMYTCIALVGVFPSRS